MMNDYLILLAGIACAGIGGELFVRGVMGIARWVRVTPAIISVTVAAFATSSPELSIAINSALDGTPEIALGDALGANVVNVTMILGLALIIGRIRCPRKNIRRDFPVALLVPIFGGAMLLDGRLSRLDGLLMLVLFGAWLIAVVREARAQRIVIVENLPQAQGWVVMLVSFAGLGLLITAGNFIVAGAHGIALAFGLEEFVVGATIVALGTTVPEFATLVVARLRGYDEIGLGTVLGSTILNGLFIAGVAAVIHPINAPWDEVRVALGFGILSIGVAYPYSGDYLLRRQGILLVVLYAAFLATIFQN